MKTCPKCQAPHNKPGTFCSRSCANSREWSEETLRKRAASNRKARAMMSADAQERVANGVRKAHEARRANLKKRLMETPTEHLGIQARKQRVLAEQDNRCAWCDLDSWLGKPITLELDHVDGDRTNNERSNLRALCPNCHSQTPTWKGKKNTLLAPMGLGRWPQTTN